MPPLLFGASIVLALVLFPASARQSVTVISGNPTATLHGPPWQLLGGAEQPSRWEMRIHDFGANWPVDGVDLGPVRLWNQDSHLVWATSTFKADTLENNGAHVPNCCQGRSDVLVRVQRDVARKQYTFEICDTVGGNCVASSTPITAFGPDSWAGHSISLAGPGYRLGFLRWYSTVVPVGTTVQLAGPAGDVADWEFQGNLRDSVHGLTFRGGSVSYADAPAYAPSCNAGGPHSFRAGYPAQLDASQSQPLDGGTTLTYQWRQLPDISPVNVLWSDQQAAKPQISGLVSGSYNFELTVTDGSGQSSTCVAHDGAVATDDQGVVITNNPAVDQLLGPQIQWGRNPWPWMDDRNKYVADLQITNIDRYYLDFWDTPAAGTVSVTAGSRNVSAQGTHFTTDVCGKGGDPTVPQDNMAMILWWRGGKGRRAVGVQSCIDNTHLVLADAYNAITATESGLSYSLDNRIALVWQFGGGAQYPANYYDNVAGFYALYYRSGIDIYLTYARKLADLFWMSPMIDQGFALQLDSGEQWAYPGRAVSALGLALRAMDGRPDIWDGLHKLWDTDIHLNGAFQQWGAPGLYDTREQGYQAFRLGLCALYDPDAIYRGKCKAAIQSQFTSVWRPVHDHFKDYSWPQFYSDLSSAGNAAYVTLSAGSDAVTLQGGTWTAAQFTPASHAWFFPCAGGPGQCGRPPSNADGDADVYGIAYQDATHARLVDAQGNPALYRGTAGDKGYAIGTGAIGWATQPFMAGIVAAGLDLEAQAMNDGGYDPATGDLLFQYAAGSVEWLKTNAVRPSTKGLYYFVGGVNCPAGQIPETASWCMSSATAANPEADRILSAEAVRGMMFSWFHHSRDAALAGTIDLLVNAQWAKPGTCPRDANAPCVEDGFYMPSYDEGGAWVSGTPPQGSNPKWFGMPFGLNPQPAWPAIRLGGPQPEKDQPVPVAFNLREAPGATRARIVSIAPSGRTSTTNCPSSPCMVHTDVRQGAHRMRVEFLSGAGAVLKTKNLPPVCVK